MKPRNTLTFLILTALLLAPTGALHGDETNRIEIDAKQIGAVISPLLFGHNLEHTRRGIWQGISAEMIANRKFAAVDSDLPMRWNTLAGIGVSVDNHEIGIDEFMALCHELDTVPQITTRFSEGTPEEAGSWVEYCNGSTATKWGKLRAERGHPEPYSVKYWYMGNELNGMSLLKGAARKNPKVLAGLFRPHIEAMKKADPSIELNVGIPGDEKWLDPLFAEAGNMLSQVQVGFYFGDASREVSMSDIVNTPSAVILPQLKSLRQLLDRAAPAGKRLGIVYYEWNVNWDRPRGDVLGGVFAAGMLNMFCREAESLDLTWANYFMPITEGAIK